MIRLVFQKGPFDDILEEDLERDKTRTEREAEELL